jgi:hypothetical protein
LGEHKFASKPENPLVGEIWKAEMAGYQFYASTGDAIFDVENRREDHHQNSADMKWRAKQTVLYLQKIGERYVSLSGTSS